MIDPRKLRRWRRINHWRNVAMMRVEDAARWLERWVPWLIFWCILIGTALLVLAVWLGEQ